ncbi:hypothetical protein [Oricola sp.]|uniref:FitA-like ribbon-helix-helix domain-containing protein n=1 Tax=Oricola sp. TaxID=1979950 RepID=UPI0025DE8237|nr:hypothetical protein [Oricola sp.]MCI5077686.1 hypothetical protein [Oricola sp.]
MATLTIRNLDDQVKQALREQAARHGVSMEEEVRTLLTKAVSSGGRRRLTAEEIVAKHARSPDKPVDQKALSDAMWEESFD